MSVELFGVAASLLGMFVGFGLLIGLLFGFFGMGGSFLVTPALMVMGYPTDVAVASGLAFVFGTSVIATLKHRDLGQVDYKLGVLMIAGTTAGIEVGKIGLHELQRMGVADTVVSIAYVGLLGGIGAFITYNAVKDDDRGGVSHDGDGEVDEDDIPDVAKKLQSYRVPPMMSIRGGVKASLWMILGVAFFTGLLSGLLGVGGGFIRMPALFYLIGVPVPVAVGTDLFEIVFSGGLGSLLYAMDGAVNLVIVVPLLAGSALGARLGAAATGLVDEDDIKVYFGVMLLLGAVAVAVRKVGGVIEMPVLDAASLAIIVGAALLVSGAIVVSSIRELRTEDSSAAPQSAD